MEISEELKESIRRQVEAHKEKVLAEFESRAQAVAKVEADKATRSVLDTLVHTETLGFRGSGKKGGTVNLILRCKRCGQEFSPGAVTNGRQDLVEAFVVSIRHRDECPKKEN